MTSILPCLCSPMIFPRASSLPSYTSPRCLLSHLASAQFALSRSVPFRPPFSFSSSFSSLRNHPLSDGHTVAPKAVEQQGNWDANPGMIGLSEDSELEIHRNLFPEDFTFGVASSAVQVEGAVSEGGRGLSIWDTFASFPGNIADGSVPDVTCAHYEEYIEDIKLMKQMGVDAYRFSISWPRLFPDGNCDVNREGIAFYNSVINHCIRAGLKPYVTLYHWDLPQYLENDPEVKGWRTSKIIEHYVKFAETCFKYFGDRVKHWITFNEIHIHITVGWGTGKMAPGRCSKSINESCPAGDSSTEPYIVVHHALLSHAAAVRIYRAKYQEEQNGKIGITADSFWYEPYSSSEEDVNAAQRFQEFETGWQLDPVITGDYPKSMRERAGERLPKFTPAESQDLKGSVDFIGINYYTSNFVQNTPAEIGSGVSWWETDKSATKTTKNVDGVLIGELMGPPATSWLHNVPWGLTKLLRWLDKRYGKVPIYITENGTMDTDSYAPLEDALDDKPRITYMKQHLERIALAIREGIVVKAYFAWAAMDNWEWRSGYTYRFGLIYVDFIDGLKRHFKSSAIWYGSFLNGEEQWLVPTKEKEEVIEKVIL